MTRRAWWQRALDHGYWESRGFEADYGPAVGFVPAASTNYREGDRTASDIRLVVIHITGGTWVGNAISHFAAARRRKRSSAHYVIGRNGEVYQMVHEKNVAWHAGPSNEQSIGIEHVANSTTHLPTDETYQASAYLVQYLCRKYDIAKNRTCIIGHKEADPGTGHNCPGPGWQWGRYMSLVHQSPQLYVGGGRYLTAP